MLKMVYKSINLGGVQTLMLRIGKHCRKEGISTVVYCEEINSPQMKDALENEKIKVVEVKNAPAAAFKNVKKDDIFLTFSLYDYIECLVEKRKKSIDNNFFYYVVHPYNTIHVTRLSILNRITENSYKNIIKKSIKEGFLFFMDKPCVQEYENYYDEKSDNAKIIPLPMEIKPINYSEIDKRCENRICDFNILSIARSDFPFKGYLKTLVNSFEKLYIKYPSTRMTIISDGEDVSLLKKWVDKVNAHCDNRIQLIEKVHPSMLEQYYEDASLYVGMGTTLLEACDKGVPSLPIEAYTYELKASGFFNDVDGRVSTMPGEGIDAMSYIEKIMNMTHVEYKELAMECRNTYEKKHDINLTYQYISSKKSNTIIKVPYIIIFENKIRRMIYTLKRLHRENSK